MNPRAGIIATAAAISLAACGKPETAAPSPTPPDAATQTITHAIIGTWTFPIDGNNGYTRTYRPDGTITIKWPDGKIADQGRFFVVDPQTLGSQFPAHDTEVTRLIDSNTVEIIRVEHTGNHRKHYARRVE